MRFSSAEEIKVNVLHGLSSTVTEATVMQIKQELTDFFV